jgi:hypothetical protein
MSPVSKREFEKILEVRLEQVQIGTTRKAKRCIGNAWRTFVDSLCDKRAERLRPGIHRRRWTIARRRLSVS